MRICVTGASGFVGSNLVHVFARPPRRGRRRARPRATSTSPTRRRARAVAASRPDAIVHAAIWNAPAASSATGARAWAGVRRRDAQRHRRRQRRRDPGRPRLDGLGVRRDAGAGGRGRAAEPGQRLRLPQGGVGARRHRARRHGIVARIAAVQGVHRARAVGAARAGRRVRLLRRRARRHAARRRALHRLGRRGPQRARHADAGDRRRRADLARARARRRPGRCTAAGASTRTGVGLARRAVAAFGLDPDLLDVGPPPARALPRGRVPRDTRLDATATAARLGVELPDLDTQLARLRAELDASPAAPMETITT